MRVKYKEASESLLKIASPNKDINMRTSVNASLDVVEHYKINIEKLIPFENQARKNINVEELEGLVSSIIEHGIRQPLTVIPSRKIPELYEVVSGERRLRASKLAGLDKLPCIIINDYSKAEEIALVENLQRKDLHPIEIGEAFKKLLSMSEGTTQLELARKVGISNKIISEVVQYVSLPDEVKNIVISKNLTNRSMLRKLLRSEDPITLLSKGEKNVGEGSRSILRISLKDEKLHFQTSGIVHLSTEKKKELIEKITDLLS